jgi:tRNA threonylcarbamoyl adenosine modification protein YjeE
VPESRFLPDEAATIALGRELAGRLKRGSLVLLEGDLGAGKTTLVRGVLQALGWTGPVRSPTFNLIQVYATEPPVMHADLYRLQSAHGLGLEEYYDTHACLIEWPDRLGDDVAGLEGLRIRLMFEGDARRVVIESQL